MDDFNKFYHKRKSIKAGSKEHQTFIEENYVVCDKCNYNNKKNRIEIYGTCLRCKNVLDQKAYLRYKIKIENKLSNKNKVV